MSAADRPTNMATLLASDGATLVADRTQKPPSSGEDSYGRGDEIGRYVILSVLGEGGMGVVYAAYDPELDRKVAVKLLHVEERERGSHTEGVSRLQREAQALARLSHPNVLTIHDVGVHRGHVFLAMEFVEGGTLSDWMTREKPTPAAIFEMFCAAGRGLVAAHAVGLVHRDFKPENVLIGGDGRPRVADFGLAVGRGTHVQQRDALEESSHSSLDHKLTVTGRAMGTPYYMAPEQYIGGDVDAAADQFSFCVALYDCLYAQHPFGGATVVELRLNLISGEAKEPPSLAGVPNAARRALMRGLSVHPNDRHASLAELLQRLRPRKSRSRWPMVAMASVAVLALGGGYVLANSDTADLCPRATKRVAEAWGERRAEVQARFESSKLPYSMQVHDTVTKTLNAYTEQWLDGHLDACEDTRVRGEFSQAMLDQRMVCLQARLDQVHALVDVMVEADDRTIEKAVVAAETLPSIGRCSNVAAMQAQTLNLPDPQTQALRKQLAPRFDHAHALNRLGHAPEARKIYEQIEPEVFVSDDRSLHAHYRRRLAGVLHTLGEDEEAENLFFAALADAAASDNSEELARVAIGFLDLRSSYQSDIQAIDRWHQVALGALVRHGADDDLEMQLIRRYGSALRRLGDSHRALDAHLKALEMHTERVGPLHYNTLVVRFNLGSVYWQLGRYDECEAEFDFVVPRWPARVGETHPVAITVLNGRGVMAMSRGRYAEAVADLELALQRRIELNGEGHRSVDDARENLGGAYASSRRYREALELHKRGLKNRKKMLGEDNRYVGWTLGNLSSAYRYLGEYEQALDYALQAREVLRKNHTGDHPEIAKTYVFTGLIRVGQGRFEEAKKEFAVAQKMLTDTKHSNHPEMVEIYFQLAMIALEEGEFEAATRYMKDVRRIDDGREKRPDNLAEYLGLEAKLAWHRGERKAAKAAQEQADALYKGLGKAWEPDRRELAQWFANTKLGETN